jgi:predicted transcriptional regulator
LALIRHLENRATLQILLFLSENGKTKLTDIDIEASKSSLYRALTILMKWELIREERVRPYTRYIVLTDNGTKAAKKLGEIESILKTVREKQKLQNHT